MWTYVGVCALDHKAGVALLYYRLKNVSGVPLHGRAVPSDMVHDVVDVHVNYVAAEHANEVSVQFVLEINRGLPEEVPLSANCSLAFSGPIISLFESWGTI